jgi:dihydrofolate reductase
MPAKPSGSPSPASRARKGPLFRVMLAVSIDGYIADKQGGVKWLDPYFTPEIDFKGFVRTIGVSIMGRTTFDEAVRMGHPFSDQSRAIVLTHRPLAKPPPGVEVYAGDLRVLAERVRHELSGSGDDVWLMGGGKAIAAFHQVGLVDRWELGLVPVLLGEGIPLFPPNSRGVSRLKLTRSRTLTNGMVEVWYERG